jgi:hypothetical protein
MRTTLTIEDRIARDLKQLAHRSGKPFKVVVNETLEAGLVACQERSKPKRYSIRALSLGGVRPDVDLDKALALADTLDDVGFVHKMELRK